MDKPKKREWDSSYKAPFTDYLNEGINKGQQEAFDWVVGELETIRNDIFKYNQRDLIDVLDQLIQRIKT